MYEQGIKRKRKVQKSEESPNGMLVTPEMDGKIMLCVLENGKDHIYRDCVEIDECGI